MDYEKFLKDISKENKPFITVLDEIRALYDTPVVVPPSKAKKRRKTDRRTINRHRREYREEVWAEQSERGDNARHADGSLKNQFYKLRREVKRRHTGKIKKPGNWEWNLSLHEWLLMWASCPAVEVGVNFYKPAYLCRGRNPVKDVQLRRLDVNTPFELSNLTVVRGKEVLYTPTT